MKKVFLPLFPLLLLFACGKDERPPALEVRGETMGTYFKVTYYDSLQRDLSPQIVSELERVNQEVNTYDSTSVISIFNRAEDSLDLETSYFSSDSEKANNNKHFITNFQAAKMVHEQSGGAFDPTLMPLVNYWGFGYTPKRAVVAADSVEIDSLLRFVGMEKVELRIGDNTVVRKMLPGVKLDFSACAKGYGVDAVGRVISKMGIEHYYVEIGGESLGVGNGSTGKGWTVGVAVPDAEAGSNKISRVVRLQNTAIATSGNYKNFYEVNGSKYAHTINPETGYPEAGNLLSASVFTDECMMSDAYATACMVMGLEKAKPFIEKLPGVEAFFIYADENGDFQTEMTSGAGVYMTEGYE